eukprot:CAMPEP_0118909384 /NCGR_PEP_ID=MMETSP1166-20130328/11983_1 /TAXON_ID=1104430 /ORGANISM="Chrysoreinhardia sp, Strain CCMP3193" /LENGTH=578 /DNA_ID=CAMNT_0006848809 /DNA_START=51 /DNA_END=1787 /DNA_ORIENTATION=-
MRMVGALVVAVSGLVPFSQQQQRPRRQQRFAGPLLREALKMPSFDVVDADASMEPEDAWQQREARQAQLQARSCDMDVIFLGTASCVPSTTRGVSCTALRYAGKTWLFDAGEGTQIQIQKSPLVHPGRVDAIFVTHSHGDHTFGLPGLLCIIGQNRDDAKTPDPIHVYGPAGLAAYLRASLQLTHSRTAAKYVVHELEDVPFVAPPNFYKPAGLDRVLLRSSSSSSYQLPADPVFGEVGADVVPKVNGTWRLEVPGSDLTVLAAPMAHTVPCVGYVVTEPGKPGKLDAKKVAPVVKRNSAAMAGKGIAHPKKVFAVIKNMLPGQVFTFPDGTKVRRDDVVADDIPGRVLVFAGDTADASRLLPLLPSPPDLVVHEATNAHLLPWDSHLDPLAVRRLTAQHGHSTPEMAADFAKRADASRLVLTHFSPRYKGSANRAAMAVMAKIELAAKARWFGEDNDDDGELGDRVVAAWDLLALPVPYRVGVGAVVEKGEAKRAAAGEEETHSQAAADDPSSSSEEDDEDYTRKRSAVRREKRVKAASSRATSRGAAVVVNSAAAAAAAPPPPRTKAKQQQHQPQS